MKAAKEGKNKVKKEKKSFEEKQSEEFKKFVKAHFDEIPSEERSNKNLK
jgi:hypothetical protein